MNATDEAFVIEGYTSRDLEESLLRVILSERGTTRLEEALTLVGQDDFTSDRARACWRSIVALRAQGVPLAAPLVVRGMMSRSMDYHEAYAYVAALLDDVSVPFVGAYCRAMKTGASRRQLLTRLEATADTVRTATLTDAAEAVRSTADLAESLAGDHEDGVQVLDDVALLKEYHESIASGDQGLNTGWGAIDRNGGLMPGELVTIVARPKVGKSALGQNLCANVLLERRERVCLYFTLEMPTKLWNERWLQILCGKDRKWVNKHHADVETLEYLERFGGIRVTRPKKSGLAELRRHCEAVKRTDGRLDLVVIDHTDFVDLGSPSENLADRVRGLFVGLKKLTGELACPMVVLHQGSRESGDGPPIARGSEGPREVSDLMLGAWRPGMDTELSGRELKLKAIVARRMPPLYTSLTFDPETLVIRDEEYTP